MARLEPSNHRMIICLFDDVFIGPLIVFGFVDVDWLGFWSERVYKVTKFKTVVIVSAILFNTDELCLWECANQSLIGLFVEKVKGCSSELMSSQV